MPRKTKTVKELEADVERAVASGFGTRPNPVEHAAYNFVLGLAHTWARDGYAADDAPTARAAYKLLEKYGAKLPPELYDENGVRR